MASYELGVERRHYVTLPSHSGFGTLIVSVTYYHDLKSKGISVGIFDFWKRKSEPLPPASGPSPDYVIAHYALRQIALSDPMQFLAILASPDAEEFIDAILKDVGEQCGRDATFNASAIKIHKLRVHRFPCVVIELPEPQEIAEAFMVAVVVMIDSTSERAPDVEEVSARFFTLEKGLSLSNDPRTVLAEWDTSAHSNYGDGPKPNVESFAAALIEYVN